MTHQYRGYDYDVNVCDANGDVDVCQTLAQYRTKMLELEQLYIRFLPNHFHPDGRPAIKVQQVSLFLTLTILELAIFGAKIQTNVKQRKKWLQIKGKRVSQQRL